MLAAMKRRPGDGRGRSRAKTSTRALWPAAPSPTLRGGQGGPSSARCTAATPRGERPGPRRPRLTPPATRMRSASSRRRRARGRAARWCTTLLGRGSPCSDRRGPNGAPIWASRLSFRWARERTGTGSGAPWGRFTRNFVVQGHGRRVGPVLDGRSAQPAVAAR